MNKIQKFLLFIFLFWIVAFVNGYAADSETYSDYQGKINGRLIIENMVEKNQGDIGNLAARTYMFGVMDAIGTLDGKFFAQTYPNSTKADIVEAVKLYYQNNPTQRHRAVVDVILSDCK